MERDLAVFGYSFAMENFNSHAHVERDGGEIQLRDQDGNFNSHAHVERDEELDKIISNTKISTHTLTWSVTPASQLQEQGLFISTHTLTWSVTMTCLLVYLKLSISTHTLTWSVTNNTGSMKKYRHQISTHTLTWSVTKCQISYTLYRAFQLTRSRGA